MEILKLTLSENLNDYLTLINQLSSTQITLTQVKEIIKNLPENHVIFIMKIENNIIGSGTVLLEQKIIHSGKKVGHLEDIIIDNTYQGKGYGKKLIDFLIKYCQENDCYKVILNCQENKKLFYQKCGFEEKSIQMRITF